MRATPLIWLGDSRDTMRAFPEGVRQIAGFQLWRVQRGLEPNDWKPTPSVGLGVQEIRIHTGTEHRVLYVAKFAEAGSGLTEYTRTCIVSGVRQAAAVAGLFTS